MAGVLVRCSRPPVTYCRRGSENLWNYLRGPVRNCHREPTSTYSLSDWVQLVKYFFCTFWGSFVDFSTEAAAPSQPRPHSRVTLPVCRLPARSGLAQTPAVWCLRRPEGTCRHPLLVAQTRVFCGSAALPMFQKSRRPRKARSLRCLLSIENQGKSSSNRQHVLR